MTDGLYGTSVYAVSRAAESPCNLFALTGCTALHADASNWSIIEGSWDTVPQLQVATLHLMHSCGVQLLSARCGPETMLRSSLGLAFKGDVVPPLGKLPKAMCIASNTEHCHGESWTLAVIPISDVYQMDKWIVGSLLVQCTVAWHFQMHWTGITLALDEHQWATGMSSVTIPALHRFLTTAHGPLSWRANFVDAEYRTIEALTLLSIGSTMDHCWTTGALTGRKHGTE